MEFTRDTFLQLQEAWTHKDREIMQGMLTPDIYMKWKEMQDNMESLGQRNVVKDVIIEDVEILDIQDYTDDEKDRFTARISASAIDFTVNAKTGKWTYPRWKSDVDSNPSKGRKSFTELWTFQWKGEGCKLIKIDQEAGESKYIYSENVLEDGKYNIDLNSEH